MSFSFLDRIFNEEDPRLYNEHSLEDKISSRFVDLPDKTSDILPSVSSVKDILGVSSLGQWEVVLPRFPEAALSAGDGTDKPVDATVTIQRISCIRNSVIYEINNWIRRKGFSFFLFFNRSHLSSIAPLRSVSTVYLEYVQPNPFKRTETNILNNIYDIYQ